MGLWKDALSYIQRYGTDYVDNTKRVCKEVLRLNLILEGPFTDIQDPINVVSGSKKWIYPKLQEISAIMLEGNLSKSYTYSYGERIFAFGEKDINQIDTYVIPILKKDPDSRRAVVSLWDPTRDSDPEKKVVPGLLSLSFKVHENRLHLNTIIRSNDIYIGWPANLYQLYVLGIYVAKKLHLELGSIGIFSLSAHYFKNNTKDIQEMLGPL